jgi:hyperosmotically inducible protein
MKAGSVFLVFVTGAVLGTGGHWYLTQPRSQDLTAQAKESVRESAATVREKAANVGESLKQTFDPESIKEELSRTGRVIREKAGKAGDYLADATANARTTGAIKTKLVADTGLAAFKINVDTSDGVVTLSGTVSSPEDIAKAMKLAMETDGVYRVVSTLQVK